MVPDPNSVRSLADFAAAMAAIRAAAKVSLGGIARRRDLPDELRISKTTAANIVSGKVIPTQASLLRSCSPATDRLRRSTSGPRSSLILTAP